MGGPARARLVALRRRLPPLLPPLPLLLLLLPSPPRPPLPQRETRRRRRRGARPRRPTRRSRPGPRDARAASRPGAPCGRWRPSKRGGGGGGGRGGRGRKGPRRSTTTTEPAAAPPLPTLLFGSSFAAAAFSLRSELVLVAATPNRSSSVVSWLPHGGKAKRGTGRGWTKAQSKGRGGERERERFRRAARREGKMEREKNSGTKSSSSVLTNRLSLSTLSSSGTRCSLSLSPTRTPSHPPFLPELDSPFLSASRQHRVSVIEGRQGLSIAKEGISRVRRFALSTTQGTPGFFFFFFSIGCRDPPATPLDLAKRRRAVPEPSRVSSPAIRASRGDAKVLGGGGGSARLFPPPPHSRLLQRCRKAEKERERTVTKPRGPLFLSCFHLFLPSPPFPLSLSLSLSPLASCSPPRLKLAACQRSSFRWRR